jgi:carbon-monoxide dehydrogenase medium subunit
LRRFELALPDSLESCLSALSSANGEAKAVAGGTDLLPLLKNALLKPRVVVDLCGIPELKRLEAGSGELRVGAAVSARTLELAPEVRSTYQALADGAALVGSVQVRTLATLGGNVCNAAPSADMAPPLQVLEAEAVIAGPKGQRRVPLADFFQGVRRTVVEPDELLVEIVVPAPAARSGGNYLRHTPRRELDIAVVGVASQVTLADGVCSKARISLAAVAPTPVRALEAEAALEGQEVTPELIERAAELAVQASRPISDQRGSAEYRRHLVRVLTRRTLTTALQRAQGGNASGGQSARNGAH